MRKLALALIIWVAACSEKAPLEPEPPQEPVSQCPAGCGPTDLQLVAYQILWPDTARTLYSGDTLRVRLQIRNLGTIASDSFTYAFIRGGRIPVSAFDEIGSIPAGATKDTIFRMVLSEIHYDSITRNQTLEIGAYAAGDPDDRNNIMVSPPIRFVPTFMRLAGPDTLRVNTPYTYQLSVVNPSPRAIRSAILSGCLAYYACRTMVFVRHRIDDVPARTTVSVPVPIRVPDDPELPLPMSAYLMLCYGNVFLGTDCGTKLLTFTR